MTSSWLIEPTELQDILDQENLILLDVRSEMEYPEGHIQGACLLEYASFVSANPPVGGLLPDEARMTALARSIGLTTDSRVVCYDDGPGAAASRFIWTLNAYGFKQTQLLNGGITAWEEDGLKLTTDTCSPTPSTITLTRDGTTVLDVETLMARLSSQPPTLIDTRTLGEFQGSDVRAAHGGRIPGAIHLEWTDAIDQPNASRLLPDDKLKQQLDDRGITADQEVVVYCQTHHRSSLSYVMLKHLGFDNVSALDGAWSNWGNRDDTPKDTG